MAKFDIGQLVSTRVATKTHVGRVVRRDGRTYTVFTFGRKQLKVDGRKLRRSKETVVLLESNLSDGRAAMRSDRQRRAGLMFEEFFRSCGEISVLREKVHSVVDLAYFMKKARTPEVHFVHYGGHGWSGTRSGGRLASGLALTTEFLSLPTSDQEVIERRLKRTGMKAAERRRLQADLASYENLSRCFAKLDGKVLVFSTCEVGRPGGFAQYVSKISGARAVIAYNSTVWDGQTNAAEVLLFWQLMAMQSKKMTVAAIVRELRESSPRVLGHKLPIVCYVDGRQVVGAKRKKRVRRS